MKSGRNESTQTFQPTVFLVLYGTKGAGKNHWAGWLQEQGFDVGSITDEVKRDPAVQQVDRARRREGIREAARAAREQEGAVFARRSYERLTAGYSAGETGIGLCLQGHLTPDEATWLREHGATLVYLDAPEEIRQERTTSRDKGTVRQEAPDEWRRQDQIERIGTPDGLSVADEMVAKTYPDIPRIDTSLPEEEVRRQLYTAIGRSLLGTIGHNTGED